MWGKPAVHMEWEPRVFLLILAADVAIAQRRGKTGLRIDARQRTPDILQDQSNGPPDRGIGPPAGSQTTSPRVDVQALTDGSIEQEKRRHRVRGNLNEFYGEG